YHQPATSKKAIPTTSAARHATPHDRRRHATNRIVAPINGSRSSPLTLLSAASPASRPSVAHQRAAGGASIPATRTHRQSPAVLSAITRLSLLVEAVMQRNCGVKATSAADRGAAVGQPGSTARASK